VVTPPGFLPGFRPAVLLEKRASEALWSHHLDEEGVVRFPVPYANPPQIDFPKGLGEFMVVETAATQFRWRHLGKAPSELEWVARGIKAPGAPQALLEQSGALKGRTMNEQGLVRFPLPFAAQPKVTVSEKDFFRVLRVTTTDFRWQHLDNTPSEATWKASGPRSPAVLEHSGMLRAQTRNLEGVTRFAVPYAVPPPVKLDNTFFTVLEVTTTHFRWRHNDNTPSETSWTALGLRGKR
jgi:hypothetical protein